MGIMTQKVKMRTYQAQQLSGRNGGKLNEKHLKLVMKHFGYMWRYKWLTAFGLSLYLFDQSFIDGNPQLNTLA